MTATSLKPHMKKAATVFGSRVNLLSAETMSSERKPSKNYNTGSSVTALSLNKQVLGH